VLVAGHTRDFAVEEVVPETIDLVFEEAFDRLYSTAYRVAFALGGDRGEAEDAAQEALARALVRWRQVNRYAEAWVVRTAANVMIGSWRKRRRTVVAARVPDAALAESDATRVDLVRALRDLPRRQREVVVLRYLADLPEAEVAAALGVSPGSVKQHASRGLTRLRSTLDS
jgi:RNA polymerase sigma-70 factor (sigma-E family)